MKVRLVALNVRLWATADGLLWIAADRQRECRDLAETARAATYSMTDHTLRCRQRRRRKPK